MHRGDFVRIMCSLLQVAVRNGEVSKLVITFRNYHIYIHITRDEITLYHVSSCEIWKLNRVTARHVFKNSRQAGENNDHDDHDDDHDGDHSKWMKDHAEVRVFPGKEFMSTEFLASLVHLSRAVHFVHAAPYVQ